MDETAVFKPATVEEIQELQRQSDDAYRNRLTKGGEETEKEALGRYTTGMHEPINSLLYGTALYNNTAEQAKYWGDISLIDTAMGKFDLKRGVTVYSGTEAKWYADWKIGEIKHIKAYLSTAVTERIPEGHCKKAKEKGETPLMLEIYVPTGTRCVYIGDNTEHPAPEYEMLLGRGLKYKVIERTENLMRLEVVP